MADQQRAGPWLSPGKAWFLVFVSFLTYVAGQIDRNIMAMLVEELKRDLGFSDEQLGILMGFGFSLTYAVSAVFIGHISDRTSRKKVLALGLATWSLLTAVCGFTKSFPGLLVARLGVGMGEATLSPTALPMVAAAFPPERRSFPISFVIAGSAVGHIVTPILIGFIVHATAGMRFGPFPLIGSIRGWQISFFVAGIIGLVILILLYFVEEPQREVTGVDTMRMGDVFAHFFQHPKYYAFLFFVVPLLAAANYGLIAWMPAYLSRTFAMNFREIGTLTGIAFIPAAIISPFIAGYIGKFEARSMNPRTHINMILLLIPLGGVLISLPMLMPTAATCVAAYAAAVMFANVWNTYGFVNLQQVVLPQYRSQCTAILMASLILIGSGLGPMIVGTFTTRVVGEDSLGAAMLLTMALMLPLALFVALAAKLDRSTHPQAIRDDDKEDRLRVH